MQLVEAPNQETIERLRTQVSFVLGLYRAELAKDPTSPASKTSRSNLLAVEHTVRQMYGDAVARDVSGLAALTALAM
jgi:hypothetical protein